MTDDDKKFVESFIYKDYYYGAAGAEVRRLCRIIRGLEAAYERKDAGNRGLAAMVAELEAENKALTYQLDMGKGDLAKIRELMQEIENAPWVYGLEIDIAAGPVWNDMKVMSWCDKPNCVDRKDTHRAKLLRPEVLK